METINTAHHHHHRLFLLLLLFPLLPPYQDAQLFLLELAFLLITFFPDQDFIEEMKQKGMVSQVHAGENQQEKRGEKRHR